MKWNRCGCLVLLIALLAKLPAVGGKAKSLYSEGQQAESKQQYENAFQFYKQAYDMHPDDVEFRSAFERTKFLAAAAPEAEGIGLISRVVEPGTAYEHPRPLTALRTRSSGPASVQSGVLSSEGMICKGG